MTHRLILTLLLILQVNLTAAGAAEVAAGPMVGVTAMRSARIWFQTVKPGTAQIVYWPESVSKGRLRSDLSALRSSRQFDRPGQPYGDGDEIFAQVAAQMRWLKNALLNSAANFKIIASGSQILGAQTFRESWSHFSDERQGFIDWLTENKVNGVMFLSGDRHYTEMLQWPRPGSYPLHELTCSPFTAGPSDTSKMPPTPGQIPGTLVSERNFCTMDFSGARTKRTLVIRSVATDGRELWKHGLSASTMRTPKP